MESDVFEVERWVARLATALEGLAKIQRDFWEELYLREAGNPDREESRDSSEKYLKLYWRASGIESRYHERRYGPIRAALTEVRDILCAHPAWTGPMKTSGNGELWLEFPNSGGTADPSAIIAGLMACGLEVGEDGFKVACAELNLLLEPGDEADRDPVREELLTGYHVVFFQGLMFGQEVSIGNDLAIVPLGRRGDFFDMDLLERLTPGAARRRAEDFTAAIVKPFRWKPEFRSDGGVSRFDWSGVESFFEDAEVLIELLALFHAAPAVRLASIAFRLHRRACRLLGNVGVHRSYSAGVPRWSTGWVRRPIEARRDALDAAARVFADRKGDRYRNCAPVISRLAEALARQGRFATGDRVLDVAIALERMYELDQGEIAFKLKTRAAFFLEAHTKNRLRVFKDVQELYDARSGIVHSRVGKKKKAIPREDLERDRQAAFDKGFDVARRSVVKLLAEGPPENWNEMLLEVREESLRARRDNGKTTAPGYRNRNGQTVIRRTDTPGNDHNQVVYELQCGGCGHRYGVNGSDIWQRKCPRCGGGRPGLSYS